MEEATSNSRPVSVKGSVLLAKAGKRRRSSLKETFAFVQNLKLIGIILVPLFLLWLLFGGVSVVYLATKQYQPTDSTHKQLFIILVVGGYFLFDCMPIPAAATVPFILLALLKISEAVNVAILYTKDANALAMASIFFALGAVSAGFSNRAALKILELSGARMRRTAFIVILLSSMLSMWFPDTGLMFFMTEVVEKIITELHEGVGEGTLGDKKMEDWIELLELESESDQDLLATQDNPDEAPTEEATAIAADVPAVATASEDQNASGWPNLPDETLSIYTLAPEPMTKERMTEDILKLLNSYKLCVLHSVAITINVGGLFWPFCSCNGITLMKKTDWTVDTGRWQTFCGVVIIILLPFTLWYLDFINFGVVKLRKNFTSFTSKKVSPSNDPKKSGNVSEMNFADLKMSSTIQSKMEGLFEEKYRDLGPLSNHEYGVLAILFVAIASFVGSDPFYLGSWSRHLKTEAKISTIAMLLVILLFILPKSWPDMFRCRDPSEEKSKFAALLDWKYCVPKFPWGVIIFIGAGLSLGLDRVVPFEPKSLRAIRKSAKNKTLIPPLGKWPARWPYQGTPFFEYHISQSFGAGGDAIKILFVLMAISFALSCLVSNVGGALIIVNLIKAIKPTLNCFYYIPCVAVASMAFIVPAGTPATALLKMRMHEFSCCHSLMRGLPIALLGFVIIFCLGILNKEQLFAC